MWADSVWGFAGVSFASFLAGLLSTSDPHLKAWLYCLAIIFGACGLFVLVWAMIKRFIDQRSGNSSTLDVTASYDMPIAKAIDYIVNDSSQKLKRSSPPRIADFGPAKERLSIERGAEHSDAFRLVAEKAISGDIRILGRRECLPINANFNGNFEYPNFEYLLREIDKDYWRTAYLYFFSCFHETVNIPQTIVQNIADPRFTGLMLNCWQVRHLWKPKTALRKFFERKILRWPRLSYWAAPESLSTGLVP